MGNFYANITLRTADSQAVVEFLEAANRSAYVLPAVHGYTLVCDKDCESPYLEVITDLAAELSRQFQCPALAVINQNDDQLWYQLYLEGTLVDEYDSAPFHPIKVDSDSWDDEPEEVSGDLVALLWHHLLNAPQFEPEDEEASWIARPSSLQFTEAQENRSHPPKPQPLGGDAELLCRTFECPENLPLVEKILRNPNYLLAIERHSELTKALGLPTESSLLGYGMLIREDETPPDEENPVELADPEWLEQFIEEEEASEPENVLDMVHDLVAQDNLYLAASFYQRYARCTFDEALDYVETL